VAVNRILMITIEPAREPSDIGSGYRIVRKEEQPNEDSREAPGGVVPPQPTTSVSTRFGRSRIGPISPGSGRACR
jgi:hypothetical protein